MKKVFVLSALLFAVVAVLPMQAQVRFGVVGGMNVSKVSFDQKVFNSDNRFGWFLGPKLYVKVPALGLGLDAAVEFNTRRLNTSVSDDSNNTVSDDSKTLQTIEIPINVRYSVGLASVASVYVATGPQFGFNVGHKRLGDYAKLKDSNITWNVGVGARLVNHLEVGVGYNIALGKFGNTIAGGTEKNKNDFKSNSWQVQLAYIF